MKKLKKQILTFSDIRYIISETFSVRASKTDKKQVVFLWCFALLYKSSI